MQTVPVDMYAKCGFVMEARDVFYRVKAVVAWTAMTYRYTKKGMMDDARWLFDNMGQQTLISCATMIAGYANWGNVEAAKELYDEMAEKNLITWVAMIAGCGKCGNVAGAWRVFDEIPKRDPSCWSATVACYAQNWHAKKAIDMHKKKKK